MCDIAIDSAGPGAGKLKGKWRHNEDAKRGKDKDPKRTVCNPGE